VDIVSAIRRVRSENVVAKLQGSDPTLAKQVVLFTAHWDHKGSAPRSAATRSTTARRTTRPAWRPCGGGASARPGGPAPAAHPAVRRDDGEESGLLGSEAYVSSPLVPLERTAAVLNVDVANVRGATRDIDALGIDRHPRAMFQGAAKLESLTVVHEPDIRARSTARIISPSRGPACLRFDPAGRDFVDGRRWGNEQDELYNASAITSRAMSTARRSATRARATSTGHDASGAASRPQRSCRAGCRAPSSSAQPTDYALSAIDCGARSSAP